MRKLFAFVLAAVTMAAVTGCNSGNDDIFGNSNPKIRAFNALRADQNIRVEANGQVIGSNTVTRGTASPELETGAGTYNFRVFNTTTGNLVHEWNDRLLETNTNYTIVVFSSTDEPDGVAARLIRENEDTTAGKAEVTFVRATNTFGNVDVYLVPAGGVLADGVKANLNVSDEDNQLFTVDPGQYQLRVFPVGTTDAPLFTQNVTLQTDSNYQLIMAAQGAAQPFSGVFYVYRER